MRPPDARSRGLAPGGTAAGDVENGSRSIVPDNCGSRVDPIRLGPDRRPALSLDAISADLAITEPVLEPEIDWRALAKVARLTRLETRVLLCHWQKGVPVYHLHVVLGVRGADAKRAYQSVVDKLRVSASLIHDVINMGPLRDSLRPAYREMLHNGGRPWALAHLDSEFAEIMVAEKYIGLISQRDPRVFEKSQEFCPEKGRGFMAINMELSKRLAAARKRLDEVREVALRAEDELRSLRADFSAAELSARREAEDALLESREPSAKPAKAVESLAGKIKTATARSLTAAGACERQRGIVAGIESEIAANRHADLLQAVGPLTDRLRTLIDEASEVATEIQCAVEKSGENLYPDELFGSESQALLWRKGQVFLALVNVIRERALFSPSLRQKFGWETPGAKEAA
jgi:hypothetical protein